MLAGEDDFNGYKQKEFFTLLQHPHPFLPTTPHHISPIQQSSFPSQLPPRRHQSLSVGESWNIWVQVVFWSPGWVKEAEVEDEFPLLHPLLPIIQFPSFPSALGAAAAG